MKFRPVREWFRVRSQRMSTWGFGIFITSTMPKGACFSVLFGPWEISLTCIFGEWE